ncbi:LCP family glycopolymer transferase [Peribacillus asahii]|uniref:LCP family glycopolymer transferase n=1 Tax=Peribacillus asahii TaxID=228899 RepID=UPI0020797082|nr:LytR family transcriptional regulator [Peribacillus asahii]USK59545.1 LytR family transcriptional regulator [Peribacillus asahii]USK84889.1 LytR family transcriptional regulator [Peribacillus asahii]
MRQERKKKKRKNKWLKFFGILLLLFLIGGAVYGAMVYQSLKGAVNSMQGTEHKSEKRLEDIKFKNKDPFSVLILGVDERANDVGRSDTMIVVTVNPKKQSMEMLSLPRDIRTEIVGHGTTDKMNHAYAYGGIPMAIKTVEAFLDVPIDYYIKMNMEGFQDIVEAVGGITVKNDMNLSHGGYSFPKGTITLNGKEALVYSRIRKEDPRGDFGRQMRQRQVIEAIVEKGASLSSLTNYRGIFKALGKNVETNLTFDEMMSIQNHYKKALGSINQSTIEGNGQRINGIWYLIVPEEERLRVQNQLKAHLDIQ